MIDWTKIKYGQIWMSENGVEREVVTLGPDYVGLKECRFKINPIYTYKKTDATLSRLLFKEIKPKRTYWINIFKSENPPSLQAGYLYSSKGEADLSPAAGNRIGCIEVTFAEGDGCG